MDYLDEHKRIFAFVTAFLVTAVLLLSGRNRCRRHLCIYHYSKTLIILPDWTLSVPGFFGQLKNPIR